MWTGLNIQRGSRMLFSRRKVISLLDSDQISCDVQRSDAELVANAR